jgi:hypothetical protein
MIFKDPEYPDHIDFDTIPIGDSLTVCLCGHLPVTEALIKALPKAARRNQKRMPSGWKDASQHGLSVADPKIKPAGRTKP